MFEDQKILAFIGARGGSKGLPDKNIRDCAGRPLIAWTIDAARGCSFIDRTIVSTDSERIAQVARQAGADVPFLRPAELATDEASQDDAVEHALRWLKDEGERYDYILRLQPTSPLRTAAHIETALDYYRQNRHSPEDTLVSVSVAPRKMGWLMSADGSGYIRFCFDGIGGSGGNRQSLPELMVPNGAIYFASVPDTLRPTFYSQRTLPFMMDEEDSLDIDDAADLARAEQRLAERMKGVCHDAAI